MHTYTPTSKAAARCVTEVHFICWAYPTVAGCLCVRCMLKVCMSVHNHVSVCVCMISVWRLFVQWLVLGVFVCPCALV